MQSSSRREGARLARRRGQGRHQRRQFDRKRRAPVSAVARRADRAVVQRDEAVGNGQAEPEAAVAPDVEHVLLREAIEDLPDKFRFDADTGVAHDDAYPAVRASSTISICRLRR